MSKGSGSRPLSVPFDEYAEKRKAIFGEPVRVRWVPPPLPEIEPGQTIAWFAEKPQEARSAPAYGLDEGEPKAK